MSECGQLTLDDTGEVIGAGTLATDFAESKAAAKGKIHYGIEATEVQLGACSLEGTRCAAVSLWFSGPKLSRMDVVLPRSGDAGGWATWTMEEEMARKLEHEAWAERVFGEKLEPKPIGGIVPFEVTPDYPRYALTAWGEICSYYDSKGGFAFLSVKYGR